MARLFFGVLLLAGLACAGFGGWQLFGSQIVSDADVALSAQAPPPPAPPPPPPPAPVVAHTPPSGDEEPMFSIEAMPSGDVGGVPARSLEPSLQQVSETAVDTLREVPVAYETPKTASYGKPFEVAFVLDATGAETAADSLPNQGAVVEARARVSERVKASLMGAAFDIELTSPEVQRLGTDEANSWRWQVTPKEAGAQMLRVELFAMIGPDAQPVRTMDGQVTVEVTQFQRAVSFANAANPLAVFLGGIGSTIGGLFGFFRFLGRRS